MGIAAKWLVAPTSMPVGFGFGRDNPAGAARFLPLSVATSAIPVDATPKGVANIQPCMARAWHGHGTALPRPDRRR